MIIFSFREDKLFEKIWSIRTTVYLGLLSRVHSYDLLILDEYNLKIKYPANSRCSIPAAAPISVAQANGGSNDSPDMAASDLHPPYQPLAMAYPRRVAPAVRWW